ncbi:MAG: DUF4159 domain-containing protein, partial [Phycisphaerae bacterium]
DGGWGYMPRTNPFRATGGLRPDSYGSMTAAGLATLYILYDQLYSRSAGRFDGRRSRNCRYNLPQSGELRQAMDDAWMWLNTRFTTDAIPEFPGGRQTLFRSQWLNYYLYSVERAGVASGFKTFGSNNWYRDLANQLVRTQQGNGSWGTIDQTCFGLLALVKGRTPVVINKLRHGEQTDWNNTPRDAATLTRWLSRQLERPMTWQIVDLDSPEADIKDAPILYLTGHKSPKFSDLEKDLLRDYVLSGGTVLAVACCSRASFARGVSTLFEEVFPRYRRQVLSKNHALWTLQYRINPDDSVTGFSDGCRTRLFVVQRGLNNAWHQNLFADYRDMFRLGANLLLYATNRQDPRSVAPAMGRGRIAGLGPAHGADASRRRGAHRIRVARVRHDRDGWTDPNALTRLSDVLLDGFDLVISETPAVDLRYADLDRFDLLWLTGHHLPPPDSDALKRLKAYLEGGGTLLATGCCGRSGFDAVFGAWMEHAFGLDALIDVPADDPLITGRLAPSSDVDVWGPLGSDLTHPRLKRPRLDPDGPAWPSKLAVPLLKGVQLRPDLNAPRRWAVIYSPLDIHCGLSGHFCVNCRGYQPQDARAIAVNAVLYTFLSKERPGG